MPMSAELVSLDDQQGPALQLLYVSVASSLVKRLEPAILVYKVVGDNVCNNQNVDDVIENEIHEQNIDKVDELLKEIIEGNKLKI